ncbi:hypothetical protein F0L46_03390 [Salinarimonas soli]|uniref:VanZ family protein n=1 Tax=Salinarimonas soli TaxID=1638099 RepID=A0A5B2VW22_9HYPH|nr:hypothetical protein F0L46_03390 [Salinarimonas soli]
MTRLLCWLAWLLFGLVLLSTLSPIELRPETGLSPNRERFLAFAMLGGAFWLAYPRHRLLVVVLLLGATVSLELLQHLAPGRHGVIKDAVVKAAGGMLGCMGGMVADRLLQSAERRG